MSAPAPMRLLIADDDPISLEVLAGVLEENGYDCVKATDGAAAWEILQRPDAPMLAILDRIMPGMDGLALVQWVRSRQVERAPYLIMVTARGDTSDLVEALDAGANDYLTKPFDPEELRARVEVGRRMVEMQGELRELNASLERRVEVRTRELHVMQSQLYANEKMASIGQLAAGVAHEINNPVSFVATNFASLEQSVTLFAQLLAAYREECAKMSGLPGAEAAVARLRDMNQKIPIDFLLKDMPKLFAESREGIRRITSIVDSMRGFARRELSDSFAPYDLNAGIKDTLVITRDAYKYGADIELELGDVPTVTCIPGQINQVLLNLIVNAAQSLGKPEGLDGKKGWIRIRTGQVGDGVFCTVEDSGPGVPPEAVPFIFDPFFTTKAPGEGTGLGLSISHDIVVHKHGGTLKYAPSTSGGACFTMTLPISRRLELVQEGGHHE